MRDRQTDRRALAEPTWEEDPVSGAAQNFCCFLFGFCFFSFSFFFACLPFGWFLVLCTRVGPAFLPYLRWYFSAVPFVLCYIPFPPPSLSLSFPASAAAGNLFDCSSACISLYFFGYVCRSRTERDGQTERGTGWCIYFVSTCSWYLFYESNYLYWDMAYTWDSCVLLRHISIYYFWRACAEIWCCCQFLMVNMMFPLTSLADMHIFISGLRVPKSAFVCVCGCVCAPFLICANLSLKFDLLFKENLEAISFAGTSHSSFCFWRVWLFFKQTQKIEVLVLLKFVTLRCNICAYLVSNYAHVCHFAILQRERATRVEERTFPWWLLNAH